MDGGDRDGERPFELEILADEEIGRAGGFLYLRRMRVRNLRRDGTRSREWLCDVVERPKGVDAVVVVLWRRRNECVEVLLRDGLRPAAMLGRPPERVPLPDGKRYFLVTELVAGIIEEGERGVAAVQRRAADEAWEEAGLRVAPESVRLLGPGVFPTPGLIGEKFWFAAAEIDDGAEAHPPAGDGSPMEEGAVVRWLGLDEAIAACERGDIEDAKTELGLRRLGRWLEGAWR